MIGEASTIRPTTPTASDTNPTFSGAGDAATGPEVKKVPQTFNSRYYNPTIGRFLQTDPIGYGDGMNLYRYCNNNPVGFVDPFGRSRFGQGFFHNGNTGALYLGEWDLAGLSHWAGYRTAVIKRKNIVINGHRYLAHYVPVGTPSFRTPEPNMGKLGSVTELIAGTAPVFPTPSGQSDPNESDDPNKPKDCVAQCSEVYMEMITPGGGCWKAGGINIIAVTGCLSAARAGATACVAACDPSMTDDPYDSGPAELFKKARDLAYKACEKGDS